MRDNKAQWIYLIGILLVSLAILISVIDDAWTIQMHLDNLKGVK